MNGKESIRFEYTPLTLGSPMTKWAIELILEKDEYSYFQYLDV